MRRAVGFLPRLFSSRLLAGGVVATGLLVPLLSSTAAEETSRTAGPTSVRPPLVVDADFEGGSITAVEIDQENRAIRFMPGGDPLRGWPCWWYFRVDGIVPGEEITLQLRGSTATVDDPNSPCTAPSPRPGQCRAEQVFPPMGKTGG